MHAAKRNHTELFADMKFRRDALQGLERCAGEVVTDILNIIETCDPDEAQMRLIMKGMSPVTLPLIARSNLNLPHYYCRATYLRRLLPPAARGRCLCGEAGSVPLVPVPGGTAQPAQRGRHGAHRGRSEL